MPVYRPNPRFFAEAIDSVLNQTLADIELIIVEDSSDRCGREIVESRQDPRIRYVATGDRTSLPKQHNRAVEVARAELIARFDADDICEADRLEKQLEFLRAHPDIAVVGSQVRIIDENGINIGTRHYPISPDAVRRSLYRVNPLSGSNVMFRRRIVDEAGGWSETSASAGLDYEWFCRLAAKGYRLANHPDTLVRYRLHGEQLKATKWRASIRTALGVKMRYWWREMDALSRLYMMVEVLALALPTAVAMRVYRTRYVRGTR